jgi:predicted ABC-type ATPase
MNDLDSRLDPEVHAKRFLENVLPASGLQEASPRDSPKAILLAGQPGAGKSGLTKSALNELSGNVVPIDPDELRNAHPDVERLRQQYPYTWAGHTHHDASQWAKELRAAAVEGRRNIILDTTLGNGDSAVTLIKDLQAKGYQVEIRGVVAHELESELGVDRRFSRSLDANGHGRYVPEEVRTQVYGALPGNLDKVHAETGIPIRLYGREGAQVYDSHTDARLPGAALEQERQERLKNPHTTLALRDGWRAQGDWHANLSEKLRNNPHVNTETEKLVEGEHAALRVVGPVEPRIRYTAGIDHTVRVRPNMVRGAVVGGTAATAFEAASEGANVADLYARDNSTGAEAALLDFGARSVGGWTGAAVGAKAGTLVGIESGPGAVVTGIIGAGLGAWGASEVVDWIEKYRINNQTDSAGRVWTFDPEHPGKGWTHRERAIVGTVGTVADRPIYGATTQLTADRALTQELNYKASCRAVELRLSAPDLPIDPYRIDSDATDTPSLLPRSWERTPDSGEWRREVVHQVYEHGIKSTTVEVADATKAAKLDETAHGIMAFNAARSPVAFAKQYEQAYVEQGWSRHGPIPEAVTWTRDHPEQVLGSDGRTYQHRQDGQWLHDGYIHDSLAEGNIRDELNETFSQIQAIQKQDAPVPDSPVPEPVDDPAEREALQPTPTTPATPTQPGHPDHPLYQQVRDGVAALDARHGRSFDATSERMTASLLVLAKDNGLDRVDHVLLSNATAHEQAGHTLFVVQGEPGNPAHQRASMPTIQAAQTPVDESMQQFEVVSREHDQRAQVQQRAQQMHDERMQQENHGRALSMG